MVYVKCAVARSCCFVNPVLDCLVSSARKVGGGCLLLQETKLGHVCDVEFNRTAPNLTHDRRAKILFKQVKPWSLLELNFNADSPSWELRWWNMYRSVVQYTPIQNAKQAILVSAFWNSNVRWISFQKEGKTQKKRCGISFSHSNSVSLMTIHLFIEVRAIGGMWMSVKSLSSQVKVWNIDVYDIIEWMNQVVHN